MNRSGPVSTGPSLTAKNINMQSFIVFVPLCDKRPAMEIIMEHLKPEGLSWADVESYESGFGVTYVDDQVITDFEKDMYRIQVTLRSAAEGTCG